ncbi:short-chain dehydrogenase [Mesorhizobium sp. L-8-10]|uniref:SDR family NAD(P)-dependent oxidoreductase n=1 Tax=Mesorhizobium sp. L-8-10 TaxID=2744523 RepID=UPI0019289D50|nr:SDR family oxidoreductase [Mesorhizobium sp. L-8-10]BCH29471.1 short-chain dehydrogenase [Mesorhizobium sp. L-8-10]
MLLQNKTAIVYGGGGAIGGAAARAFAREGAKVFLAGRSLEKLEAVACDIARFGGAAATAVVDALDAQSVERHAEAVAEAAGAIDVALNAVGIFHVQGQPFAELSVEDFMLPIEAYTRTVFITAKAASRFMACKGSGVFMMISTPGARLAGTGYLGYGTACAAKEGMARLLAAELAPVGVRVVCLRPHAIPEASARGSHSEKVFRPIAERAGLTVGEMLEGAAEGTLLKRLPTLEQVAETAAFMASDRAGAMTGVVANLTCGAVVD